MKLNMNWKILLGSLAIMGILAASFGYIVGVSGPTVEKGIEVWRVVKAGYKEYGATSYKTIPGMALTVDVPITTKLVITFWAECATYGEARMEICLRVDGILVTPKNVDFTSNGTIQVRSCTWVKEVPAGIHNIRVKWRRTGSVNMITVNSRSLVVFANTYESVT
jgi:hypothetical protein